ncbi:hypothetical protein HHUSO_G27479 [Huso huso]|uniref:Uncharacterized protein n=1 Tax=Huso huso TaxID=61971 RepID=A0ABR0YK05_HUSHU
MRSYLIKKTARIQSFCLYRICLDLGTHQHYQQGRCLVFINRRSIAATKAAASARRSLPALDSQTAGDMRKPSDSVLGQ